MLKLPIGWANAGVAASSSVKPGRSHEKNLRPIRGLFPGCFASADRRYRAPCKRGVEHMELWVDGQAALQEFLACRLIAIAVIDQAGVKIEQCVFSASLERTLERRQRFFVFSGFI